MKTILLTQGKFTVVDDSDYSWLNQWKWCANRSKGGNFYAVRVSYDKNGKYSIYMAREILGLERGDSRQTDHRNHNTLDNRRNNIRISSAPQNQMNQKPHSNTTSGYKGISWHKQAKKWRARIMKDRREIHLGYFSNEVAAASAYNKAARNLFGEFAYLNLV